MYFKDLDRRTIVIDCDLKRPMQHIYAGVWQHPGLVGPEEPKPSRIVCSGWGVRSVDSPCWFRSEITPWLSKMHQLADLVAELKDKFDYVIIDAPPVLPLADMQVLASMGDLLAYVVKASMTGRDVVQKALKALGENANIGIILNGLDAIPPILHVGNTTAKPHHEQLK